MDYATRKGHAMRETRSQQERLNVAMLLVDLRTVLRIRGHRTTCYINGVHVITFIDRHLLGAGAWGAYVANYPGGPFVRGRCKRILIAG